MPAPSVPGPPSPRTTNTTTPCSERWRYIRYADGSEELYDHRSDPNEWTNLAKDRKHAAILREHARWLPKVNAAPVPGIAVRLLLKKDGVWLWEGRPIKAEEKEP